MAILRPISRFLSTPSLRSRSARRGSKRYGVAVVLAAVASLIILAACSGPDTSADKTGETTGEKTGEETGGATSQAGTAGEGQVDTTPADSVVNSSAPVQGADALPTLEIRRQSTTPLDGSSTASSETSESTEVMMLQLPNVADTVVEVRPAVVSILAEVATAGMFGPLGGSSSGTGVIFTAGGLVLTNNHVIEGAQKITVTLDDGTQLEAGLVGTDWLSDLAVLRLPSGDYPFLPVSEDIELRVGEWVIAIGNALALPGGPTVTVGVVSALGRSRDAIGGTTLNDLVQTDTVINPGNSGGPLLSLRGELVGINTAVLRGGGRGAPPIEGIGFAINMATVSQVSAQIIEIGHVRWAYMGLNLDDLTPEIAARANPPIREGVVVLGVGPDGPSDRAGLLRGDIILAMEGRDVTTVIDLLRLLRQEFQSGQEVEVDVFREGVNLRLRMVLGERPPG